MIIYILTKLFAYIAWCYFGFYLFGKGISNRKSLAIAYGIIRLLIGIFIGSVIIGGAVFLFGFINNPVLAYFLVYPPTRFLEWSVIFLIMKVLYKEQIVINKLHILFWILGGIVISCLADIPILFFKGKMIGRIFC